MAGVSFNTNGDAGLQSLTDQINARAGQVQVRDGKLPHAAPGTLYTKRDESGMTFHVAGDDGKAGDGFTVPDSINLFQSVTTTTTAPTTTQYPDDGDYGWHYNSSSDRFYWTLNYGGTVRYPHIATFEGAISDLSGAITLTQHGDLSGDALTKHKFAQISGAITAAQHGSQTLATLHAVADATNNGFMSAAQFTKLGSYPADCTTTANDSNAVQRAAGVINGTQYNVSGTRIITARQTGWTAPTGTSTRGTFATGAVTLSQLAEHVKALLEDLGSTSGHGLIDV